MGLSWTPDEVRERRRLFEEAVGQFPDERDALLQRHDAATRRGAAALLAVDAHADAVLYDLGVAADDDASIGRWDRLLTLLARAGRLAPAAHEALLDVLSDGDATLRADLAALLQRYADDPSHLDQLPADAPAPPGSDDPLVGTLVGPYRILDHIGKGGMGVVYRALDTRLGRPVAVKFLPTAQHADADADARFVQEARAVSSIDHPNIAVVHEIGRTEAGQRYIVMAFYDGDTLRRAIANGPMPVEQVIDYGLQLARGLGRAHEHDIVHRDVKPENVIVTRRGELKILDFGLAKQGDVHLTAAGMTLGTLAYMSPEQTFGADVDHRTDIWALGVVLFELLTGRHPFRLGHTVSAEAQARIAAAVRELRPEAPPELSWILDTLLQKNPDERYQHLTEVVADLEALQRPGDGGDVTGLMAARPEPVSKPDRRAGIWHTRMGRAAGGGAVLTLLALLGVWSAWPEAGPSAALLRERRAEAKQLHDAGLDHYTQRRFARAQASFEQALGVDSTYSEAWTSLAATLRAQGDYAGAVRCSRTAIRLDSTNANAYYNLGLALDDDGQAPAARRAYEQAIAASPTMIPAYSALGYLLIGQGRANEALDVLHRATRTVRDSPYMFLIQKNLGKAHLAQRDPVQALAALESAYSMRPDFPETLALLAETHALLGRVEERETFTQAYLNAESDLLRRRAFIARLDTLRPAR